MITSPEFFLVSSFAALLRERFQKSTSISYGLPLIPLKKSISLPHSIEWADFLIGGLKNNIVIHITPEAIIAVAAFRDETVSVWIPLQISSEGVQNHDETRREVFGLIHIKE